MTCKELRSLSDNELLRRLSNLLRQSRRVEAELVAHIGEVEARRLYASEAASSMFVYCTEILHLSEHEAYLRITAARASRKYPVLLAMLADGRLHLSGIARLASHLTEANCETVLARAAHRSKRQIEELIAELSPRPDVPTEIRKLPAPRAKDSSDAQAVQLVPERVGSPPIPNPTSLSRSGAPQVVKPLAPARYRIQFTATAALKDKLERLKALMRSAVPDGDLATLIEVLATEKLERLAGRGDRRDPARPEGARPEWAEYRGARAKSEPAFARRRKAFCQDSKTPNASRASRCLAVLALYPRAGEACRARPRWRPMYLC